MRGSPNAAGCQAIADGMAPLGKFDGDRPCREQNRVKRPKRASITNFYRTAGYLFDHCSSNNFKTFLTDNSDTEIILKLYELYGDKCVDYLKGMFSFAIWDTKKKKLFLARDHLGIKPLYFSETNYGFIFSSEIRTICKINKEIFTQTVETF